MLIFGETLSLRTVAGCVWVFWARCRNVRSAKRSTGQKPPGHHTAVKDVLTRAPYHSAGAYWSKRRRSGRTLPHGCHVRSSTTMYEHAGMMFTIDWPRLGHIHHIIPGAKSGATPRPVWA